MRYVLVGSRTGRRRAMSFSRKNYLEKTVSSGFRGKGRDTAKHALGRRDPSPKRRAEN